MRTVRVAVTERESRHKRSVWSLSAPLPNRKIVSTCNQAPSGPHHDNQEAASLGLLGPGVDTQGEGLGWE